MEGHTTQIRGGRGVVRYYSHVLRREYMLLNMYNYSFLLTWKVQCQVVGVCEVRDYLIAP